MALMVCIALVVYVAFMVCVCPPIKCVAIVACVHYLHDPHGVCGPPHFISSRCVCGNHGVCGPLVVCMTLMVGGPHGVCGPIGACVLSW